MRCNFEKLSFGVLSVCTLNNSLNSYRIVMVQHALKSPFSSVSNDMWYILSCATFGNSPSSTQTNHLRRSSRHFPSSTYYPRSIYNTDTQTSIVSQPFKFSQKEGITIHRCAPGEKQASLPELVNVDRTIVLTVWTCWMTEKLSSVLIYIFYISNNTTALNRVMKGDQ